MTRQIQGNDALQQMVKQAREENPGNSLVEKGIPVQTYKLDRDDGVPMQFEGRLVGSTGVDPDGPRGTEVSIYVTRRGTIITHVFQWQRHERGDEQPYPIKRSRSLAAAHQTADEARAWLIKDGGGLLGTASKRAWDEACANWAPLQNQEVEVID